MKSLLIIFGTMLLIIATPFIFTAIDDGVTETTSQSFSNIAVTTNNATITVGRAVYNDDSQAFTTIASNVTNDSPTAFSYNSVSRALVVTGLVSSVNRTLTATFRIDSTSLPTGGGTIYSTLGRWFWIFSIVGSMIGAIYAFFT